MAQGKKKKSRLWSHSEIKKIVEIVESAIASGKTKLAGMDEAATHFGVTRNAINIRYGRYKKGESMTRIKRNTAKTSTKGIKRGPYGKRRKYTKRNSIAKYPITHNVYPVAREITFDIRDIKVDLVNKKITFVY